MKKKDVNKKLVLNRNTVVNLQEPQMGAIKGGNFTAYSCEPTETNPVCNTGDTYSPCDPLGDKRPTYTVVFGCDTSDC